MKQTSDTGISMKIAFALVALTGLSCNLDARRFRRRMIEEAPEKAIVTPKPMKAAPQRKASIRKKTPKKKMAIAKNDEIPAENMMDWKTTTTRQFQVNAQFLQNVITEGETDQKERDDFSWRFKAQEEWFTQAMSEVSSLHDEHYKKIEKKAAQMEELVTAIRFVLGNVSSDPTVSLWKPDKLNAFKTHVLYEINAAIAQSRKNDAKTLNDAELLSLVDDARMSFQYPPVKKVEPISTPSHPKPSPSYNKLLEEKEQELLALQIDKERLQDQLKEYQQKMKDASRAAKEDEAEAFQKEKEQLLKEFASKNALKEQEELKARLEADMRKEQLKKENNKIEQKLAKLKQENMHLEKQVEEEMREGLDIAIEKEQLKEKYESGASPSKSAVMLTSKPKKMAQSMIPDDPYAEFEKFSELFDLLDQP